MRLLGVGLPVLVWAVFTWWYSNTGGPLSDAEIEHYVGLMEARGTDPERLDLVRSFLERDTGDDFVMLNVIEFNDQLPKLAGLPAGADASDSIDKYMEHMWPALFSRACHPVAVGTAAADALDVWGIKDANSWSQGALMRYRSRRDMMEISTNPDFEGPHDFKIAAMAKTVAFPLDPWANAGDPRLLLGLISLIVMLLLGRRR